MEPKRKATIDPSLAFYLAGCTKDYSQQFLIARPVSRIARAAQD